MNILALDTATPVLDIVLSVEKSGGGQDWWRFSADAGGRYSEIVMEASVALLEKAGICAEDVDIVACMKGPGSFTGLRVGYAVAKGLCLPTGAKLSAVGTLECAAYARRFWQGAVIPAIDAKQRAFFAAVFAGRKRLCGDIDADAEHIAARVAELLSNGAAADAGTFPVLVTGADAPLLMDALAKHIDTRRLVLDTDCRSGCAKALAELAPAYIEDNLYAAPEYIRKSDAEIAAGK